MTPPEPPHTPTSAHTSDQASPRPGVSPSEQMFASDAPMPTRIGPYLVKHRIGVGGMGFVYGAVRDDPSMPQKVAVKLLRPGAYTPDIAQRFTQERRILASLNHPNIARLLDGGSTENGTPYFVMELVSGLPITDYCDTNKLGPEKRLEIFRKVCAAVHYAHQHLVVHRDLKPSNILVTPEGEPKLLDFGIAKVLSPVSGGADEPFTMVGGHPMTPEYASPEQVRGDPITTASDVYSLGVLLYELLTGRRPYRLRTRLKEEVRRVICESDPLRPSTAISRGAAEAPTNGAVVPVAAEDIARNRGSRPAALQKRLAGDIDDIVMMAMEKAPSARYKSAEEFSKDIERHLGGMPVEAHKAHGAWYYAKKFVGRHRAGVATAAIVFFAVAVGGGLAAWQWRVAERERAAAQAARDLAQKRFDMVRSLAKTIRNDVHDEVQRLPGSIKARDLLVKTSQEYITSLQATAGDDPALLADLAQGFEWLAQTQNGIRGQSKGEATEADRSIETALDYRRRVLTLRPTDPAARLGLASTLYAKADLVRARGDTDAALALYDDALKEIEAASTPGGIDSLSPNARDRYASILNAKAKVLLAQKKRGDAEKLVRQAIGVREQLARDVPTDPLYNRNLDVANGTLADILAERGELEQAIEMARKSLSDREALSRKFPDNGSYRRDVPVQRQRLAVLYRRANMNQDAAAAMSAVVDEFTELRTRAEQAPADARPTSDLQGALLFSGNCLEALGHDDDALKKYQAAAEIGARRVEHDPGNTPALKDLGTAQLRAGQALVRLNRIAEARPMLVKAEATIKAWATLTPNDPDPAKRLAEVRAEAAKAAALR